MQMEAEVGGRQPQAKDAWSRLKLQEAKTYPPRSPESVARLTRWFLDFWPPEPGGSKCLLS